MVSTSPDSPTGSLVYNPAGSLPTITLRMRLAKIDLKITLLRAELAELGIERKTVTDALKMVTYPILTLPPEITAEIFVHDVSTDTGLQRAHILASVCRAWREIAINLPKMWSRIILGPGISDELTQLRLQRSANYDLDVDIAITTSLSTISTVAPLSGRWRSFAYHLEDDSPFPITELEGKLPRLKFLTFNLDGPPSERITAFSDAPLLRFLHLKSEVTSAQASWFSLPWTQLTDFSCDAYFARDLVEILDQMLNLENLTLTIWDCGPGFLPSSPICLPRLHALNIICAEPAFFFPLDYLTLPELQHLSAQCHCPDIVPPLLGLLQRSGCSLSTLSLREVSSYDALKLLESTPTVVDLTITFTIGWDRRQESFFGITNAGNTTLPNLRKFRVETPGLMPYSNILNFLQTRCGAGLKEGLTALQEFRYAAPACTMDDGDKWKTDPLLEDVTQKLQHMADVSSCNICIRSLRTSTVMFKGHQIRDHISYTLDDMDLGTFLA